MNAGIIEARLKASGMKPGKEHRVAFIKEDYRVIKVADAKRLATETLYDYLTDLLLSNYFFEDDLQLLGCYELDGRLQLVTSQPYVSGRHPDWNELKSGLAHMGLRDPGPGSKGGNFIIDDDRAGEIDVYDLHINNVILDSRGRLNPIDAHFYFDDRSARMRVLQILGLNDVTGPSDLHIRMEQDNESHPYE